MYRGYKKGFTLVELIVVITILAILGTIAYISFLGYNVLARDTVRVSDIATITKAIELSRLETGFFPEVSQPSNVTFSGAVIWKQGSFGSESRVSANRISEIPIDPLTRNEYAYAVTQSTQEYQVGTILEKSPGFSWNNNTLISSSYAAETNTILPNFNTVSIKGNYNGKYITYVENISPDTKNIYILGVPSILSRDINDVSLEQIYAQKSFAHAGGNNAPGKYVGKVQEKGWDFIPTIISGGTNPSGNTAIVYQGTNQELSTSGGKIAFITNLKDYYSNTKEVIDSSDFSDVKHIDSVNQPETAISLVNTYLQNKQGGLDGTTYAIAQTPLSPSSNPSNNTSNPCALSVSEVSDLNNWVHMTLFSEGGEGPFPLVIGNASPGTSDVTAEQWCSITNISLEYGFSPVLTSIPEAFGKLQNLKGIALSDQNISQLPDSLSQLSQLQSINLTGNTGLGNLNGDFSSLSPETCENSISSTGKRVCMTGNGTTIHITLFP